MKRFLVPLLVVGVVAAAPADAAKIKQNYFRVGNSGDGTATLGGGVVLMGGSTDVDAAFQWMCDRASGGDFLVVRATGTDAYNPYIQDLCPTANSVATVIVDSIAAANDPVNVRLCAEGRNDLDRRRRPVELHQLLERHGVPAGDPGPDCRGCPGRRHQRRHSTCSRSSSTRRWRARAPRRARRSPIRSTAP